MHTFNFINFRLKATLLKRPNLICTCIYWASKAVMQLYTHTCDLNSLCSALCTSGPKRVQGLFAQDLIREVLNSRVTETHWGGGGVSVDVASPTCGPVMLVCTCGGTHWHNFQNFINICQPVQMLQYSNMTIIISKGHPTPDHAFFGNKRRLETRLCSTWKHTIDKPACIPGKWYAKYYWGTLFPTLHWRFTSMQQTSCTNMCLKLMKW
jgi:hypothetical protein